MNDVPEQNVDIHIRVAHRRPIPFRFGVGRTFVEEAQIFNIWNSQFKECVQFAMYECIFRL